MANPVKLPEFPELPRDLPPTLVAWCRAVEQNVRIMRGLQAEKTNTRFVSIDDLIKAGVINEGDIV